MSSQNAHREDGGDALWPQRFLTDGQIVISRRERTSYLGLTAVTLRAIGSVWRELTSRQKWGTCIAFLIVAVLVGTPFRLISEDVAGAISTVVVVAFGVLLLAATALASVPVKPAPASPELVLARSDSTEARVAGAATRAWTETVREPSWHSPYLASNRATFDGQAEVDKIIDMALRIHEARTSLGPRPSGSAARLWDRQHLTLERAAHQLGRRADALIRYRDQAARLSGGLRDLADLERVAATTAEIDGLAVEVEVALGHDRAERGIADIADEVAIIRATVAELLDEMVRTSAGLTDTTADPFPIDVRRA